MEVKLNKTDNPYMARVDLGDTSSTDDEVDLGIRHKELKPDQLVSKEERKRLREKNEQLPGAKLDRPYSNHLCPVCKNPVSDEVVKQLHRKTIDSGRCVNCQNKYALTNASTELELIRLF